MKKQVSQMRTGSSMPSAGRGELQRVQLLQKIKPQRRQWCFLTVSENSTLQLLLEHFVTSASSCQWAFECDSPMPLPFFHGESDEAKVVVFSFFLG